MKILVDGTNPENGDNKLYLEIIEVDINMVCKEMGPRMGSLQYVYIEDLWDKDYPVLFSVIADLKLMKKELFNRADAGMKAVYTDDNRVPEEDYDTVCINQFLIEIMAITGCEACHYSYF